MSDFEVLGAISFMEMPELIPNDLKSLFTDNFSFPRLKVENNGNSFSLCLKSSEFCFFYSLDILEQFINKNEWSTDEKWFFKCYCIFAYIHWRVSWENGKHIAGVSNISNSLSKFCSASSNDICCTILLNLIEFYTRQKNFNPKDISQILKGICHGSIQISKVRISVFVSYIARLIPISKSEPQEISTVEAFYSSINERKLFISENDGCEIISILANDVIMLNPTALRFFRIICKSMPIDTMSSIVAQFPHSLYDIVNDDSFQINREENSFCVSLKPFQYVNPLLEFVEEIPEFDIDQNTYPDYYKSDYDCIMISRSLNDVFALISSILIEIPQSFSSFLKNCYILLQSSLLPFKIYAFYYLIITIIRVMSLNESEMTSVVSYFANSLLFTEIDSFNPQICYLRRIFVEVLIEKELKPVVTLINVISARPTVYIHVLKVLYDMFPRINNNSISSEDFVQVFSGFSNFFKYLHQSSDVNNRVFIEFSRSLIIMFINKVVQRAEIANSWFSIPSFVSTFLSFFYEVSLQTVSNRILIEYLNIEKCGFGIAFISGVSSCFLINGEKLSNDNYIGVSIILLTTIRNSINKNKSHVHLFSDMIDCFIKTIYKIPKNDNGYQLLVLILNYLSVSLEEFPLDSKRIEIFIKDLISFTNPKFNNQIRDQLFKILANDTVENYISPIRFPLFLDSCFHWCDNVDDLLLTLKRIKSMIEKSLYNRSVMHDNHFDVFLINQVKQIHLSSSYEDILNQYLSILTLIHSHITSPSVLRQYIDIMCFGHKSISINFRQRLIKHFSSVLSKSMSIPSVFVSLSWGSHKFDVSGIDLIPISNGFCICHYAFIEPFFFSNNTKFFELTDLSGNSITFNLMFASIQVTFSNENGMQKFFFDISHAIGSWEWITASFVYQNQGVYLSFYCKGVDSEAYFSNWSGFESGPLNCSFGLCSQTRNKIPIMHINSMGLFRLGSFPKQDMAGNASFFFKKYQPYYYFWFPDHAGSVSLQCNSTSTRNSFELSKSTMYPILRFPQIFEHIIDIKSLLILFTQLDLSTDSGSEYGCLSLQIVDLLTLLFQCNVNLQKEFCSQKCAQMISHFLCQCNRIHLTIPLFHRFVTLLRSIDNTKLQKSMMKSIVLNYSIWKRTEFPIQKEIIKQWIINIAPDFRQLFFNSIDIFPILISIRDRICPDAPYDSLINELSSFILFCFSDDSFSKTLNSIICVMLLPSKIEFIKSLMSILYQAFNSIKSNSTISLSPSFDQISYIMKYNNQDLLIQYVEILILIHQKGVLNDIQIEYHANIIDNLIPECLAIESTLLFFLSKVNSGYFHFLNILCSLIKKFKQELIDYVSSRIVFFYEFTQVPSRLFYLLEIFSCSSLSIHEKLYSFLSSQQTNNIDQICSTITIFDMKYSKSMLRPFLSYLINHCNRKDMANIILPLCYGAIFYTYDLTSSALSQCFSRSPFYDVVEDLSAAQKEQYNESKSQPIGKLCFSKETWLDAVLAQEALILFQNYPNLQFLHYDLVLCGLVFKSHPNEALRHLQTISVSDYQMPALHFAIFCSIQSNFDSSSLLPVPLSYPKVVLALESVFSNVSFHEKDIGTISQITAFISLINKIRGSSLIFSTNEIVFEKAISLSKKRFEEDMYRSMRLMSRLYLTWKEMTNIGSPWHFMVSDEPEELLHRIRDRTLCHNYPLKMKSNRYFNSHLKSSLQRDSGSGAIANQLYEKHITQSNSLFLEHPIRRYFMFPDFDPLSLQKIKKNKNSQYFEEIDSSFECELIYLTLNLKGSFDVASYGIRIQVSTSQKIIPFSSVEDIWRRPYLHQQTALEIFTSKGASYFVNFSSTSVINVLRCLEKYRIRGFKLYSSLPKTYLLSSSITNDWINGKISNFSYLLLLNFYSGRTFNCQSQYPLMPWVLSDYDSEVLDLNNVNIYRDLSKPMGAINPSRLEVFKKKAVESSIDLQSTYLYQTAPLCPMQLYSWLIRMEPFTTLHVQLQGGKFDNPNRLFKSITQSYKLCINHLHSFSELCPEFYFLPEFLMNSENFDLGLEGGSDVILPNWAKSPIDFVYHHRKALESRYVSESLHNWIDLIWGFKQIGDNAISSDNVYDPMLYESIWSDESSMTNIRQKQIKTVLLEVGQIPTQLFTAPHPQRASPKSMAVSKDTFAFPLCNTKILSLYAVMIVPNKIQIYSVTPSNYSSYVVDFVDDIQVGCHSSYSLSNPIAPQFVDNSKWIQVSQSGRSILVVESKGACSETSPTFSQITGLSCDSHYIVASCQDGTTHIWSLSNIYQQEFFTRSNGDDIYCCDINHSFDLVVSCSKGGLLQIVSIRKKHVQHVVSLGKGVPKIIRISPSWGFLLVYIENNSDSNILKLYNINGMLLNETHTNEIFVECEMWSDNAGFDFCALSSSSGKIYVFELYYLNIEKPTYWNTFMCTTLCYVTGQNCLIGGGKKGNIVVFNNLQKLLK